VAPVTLRPVYLPQAAPVAAQPVYYAQPQVSRAVMPVRFAPAPRVSYYRGGISGYGQGNIQGYGQVNPYNKFY